MLFTTPEQAIVLAVVLVSGWMLGFASAPNAAKAKRRAKRQAESYAAYYRDAEDKLRAAHQRATDLKDELAALRADYDSAEQTIVRLRSAAKPDGDAVTRAAPLVPMSEPAAPDGAASPASSTTALLTPTAGRDPRPARDDLTRIGGIDGLLVTRLFSLGVLRFTDIEALSAEDELALEQRLALPAGYIARAQWRAQAAALRSDPADTARTADTPA